MSEPRGKPSAVDWPKGGFQWNAAWREEMPAVRGIHAPPLATWRSRINTYSYQVSNKERNAHEAVKAFASGLERQWSEWGSLSFSDVAQPRLLKQRDKNPWFHLFAKALRVPLGENLAWCAHTCLQLHGVPFAMDMALTRWQIANEEKDWVAPMLDALGVLRQAIACAGSVEYEAAFAFADEWRHKTPFHRVGFAYLFPHVPEWSSDCLDIEIAGDFPMLLECVMPPESAAAYLDRHAGHHAKGLRAGLALQAQLHGAGAFPVFARVVEQRLGKATKAEQREALNMLARMEIPELIPTLARHRDHAVVREALDKLAKRWPAAVRLSIDSQPIESAPAAPAPAPEPVRKQPERAAATLPAIELVQDFSTTFELNQEMSAAGFGYVTAFLPFGGGRAIAYCTSRDNDDWLVEIDRGQVTKKPLPRDIRRPGTRICAFKLGERFGLLEGTRIHLFGDIESRPVRLEIANPFEPWKNAFDPSRRYAVTATSCGHTRDNRVPVIFGYAGDQYTPYYSLLEIDEPRGSARWIVHQPGNLPRPVRYREGEVIGFEQAPGNRCPWLHDFAWTGSECLFYAVGTDPPSKGWTMSFSLMLRTDVEADRIDVAYEPDESCFGKVCANFEQVVLTPHAKGGPRKGRQFFYDLRQGVERAVKLPRGFAKFRIRDVDDGHVWMTDTEICADDQISAVVNVVACRVPSGVTRHTDEELAAKRAAVKNGASKKA